MIIWIDGPINAGKTTVAKRLAALRPRTAHIEVDDLRDFVRCLPLRACIRFCIEDAAVLARSWRSRGLDVVLSWPVSAGNLDYFRELVAEPVRAFTLLPRLEVALSQRGARVLSAKERRRIRQMYAAKESHPAGAVIDNSDEPADQTVRSIMSVLSTAG
jgi:hypothetical protein